MYRNLKLESYFSGGQLSRPPKIYKISSGPPLRPIVNMSVAVSLEMAQHFNSIVQHNLKMDIVYS